MDGGEVPEAVEESKRDKGFEINGAGIELWFPDEDDGKEERDAEEKVHAGDEIGKGEVDEQFLGRDVVDDCEEVPKQEVEGDLDLNMGKGRMMACRAKHRGGRIGIPSFMQ